MRATDVENPTSERSNFYASQDDLLNRVKLSEWSDFLQFVVASLRDTARIANRRPMADGTSRFADWDPGYLVPDIKRWSES